jgi:hypothetical protein
MLLGGEGAHVVDGGVLRRVAGGDPSVGEHVRGVVVDVGVGTPGTNLHVFQTATVTAGFNPLQGEIFACATSCAVLDFY